MRRPKHSVIAVWAERKPGGFIGGKCLCGKECRYVRRKVRQVEKTLAAIRRAERGEP